MTQNDTYNWTFTNIGGVTRVTINSGADIANLHQLDQKLWTVLSSPVSGLEFDKKTLQILDTDHDGKIRVNEILAAAKWTTSALRDADLLLKSVPQVALADLNADTPEGSELIEAAKRLQRADNDTVTLDDIAKAREAYDLKIKEKDEAVAPTADTRPYGDNTDDAVAAVLPLREKIADYFLRCKLNAYDPALAATDGTTQKLQEISQQTLNNSSDLLASCPIALPSADSLLHLDATVNPVWQAKLDAAMQLTHLHDNPGAVTLSEQQWNDILAKIDAYTKELADQKSAKLEDFGKQTKQEDSDITLLDHFLHLRRDLYKFLCNYVVLSDFYSRDPQKLAVFQAGQLYIDQRCCDLCLRVEDLAKHADMANLSGMYLIYLNCSSKTRPAKFDIVAALTDGDTDSIRVGKNAVFYDRDGLDWDATITKIVDNPISIRQAFWAPYKKVWNFITEKINKKAAEKEAKQMDDLTAKADNATDKIGKKPETEATKPEGATEAKANEKKAQMFDIAKFAGIFAAIGLALGAIGGALATLGGFMFAKWYNTLILIGVIVLIISGPSMLVAWLKLRKRDLGPVLNANGWAINAKVKINTRFGATLTSLAQYPVVTMPDPYADKKMPLWLKILIPVLILGVVFLILYLTDNLGFLGIVR